MGRHIEKDTVEEELDPRTTLEIEAFLAWLDVQRGLSPTTQIAYGTDLRQLALSSHSAAPALPVRPR